MENHCPRLSRNFPNCAKGKKKVVEQHEMTFARNASETWQVLRHCVSPSCPPQGLLGGSLGWLHSSPLPPAPPDSLLRPHPGPRRSVPQHCDSTTSVTYTPQYSLTLPRTASPTPKGPWENPRLFLAGPGDLLTLAIPGPPEAGQLTDPIIGVLRGHSGFRKVSGG